MVGLQNETSIFMVYSLLNYVGMLLRHRAWTAGSYVARYMRTASLAGRGVKEPANEVWCNYRVTHGQKSIECGVPIAAVRSISPDYQGAFEGCSGRRRGGGKGRARGGGPRGSEPRGASVEPRPPRREHVSRSPTHTLPNVYYVERPNAHPAHHTGFLLTVTV